MNKKSKEQKQESILKSFFLNMFIILLIVILSIKHGLIINDDSYFLSIFPCKLVCDDPNGLNMLRLAF